MSMLWNGPGLAFFLAALGIASALAAAAPWMDGEPFLLSWAASLGALDLVYRWVFVRPSVAAGGAELDCDVSLLWPVTGLGGRLLFLPAWIFSIAFPVFYVLVLQDR